MATKSKEFPTELLNKYYTRGVELCDAETSMFCYCGRLATGLHTMHCPRFASKVKSKCKELAKAAGGGMVMKQQTFVIIKSYKRFLASEHSRGVRQGCLGEKCFVHGCDSKGPLYPVGDARFWCGMCEKHADMRKSYKNYITDRLDELKLLLDFDNMLYEEV